MASEHGPFATLQEAASTPAVRAIYDKARASTQPGPLAAGSSALIEQACEAAGVELGDYDRSVIRWLGNWEPHVCQVIAGWVTRAALEAGGSR